MVGILSLVSTFHDKLGGEQEVAHGWSFFNFVSVTQWLLESVTTPIVWPMGAFGQGGAAGRKSSEQKH